MDLSHAVGIISGASSGIGLATARLLSRARGQAGADRARADRLEQLAGELKSEAVTLAGDIADPALPQALVDKAIESFARLDFVFNNAGIMNIGSVEQYDDQAMTDMIRVNVEAAVRMAYTAVRVFRGQGRGDLITTSSILGMKVRPTVGVYAGTKYAVEAFSESLRLELAGTGVRVMVIEPGYTETDLQEHWSDEQKAALKAITKPVQPEEIAKAVQFMLEQPDHVVIPRLLMVPAEQQL